MNLPDDRIDFHEHAIQGGGVYAGDLSQAIQSGAVPFQLLEQVSFEFVPSGQRQQVEQTLQCVAAIPA